eukprot:11062221-Lingulodinium_polyedra.AAC.1
MAAIAATRKALKHGQGGEQHGGFAIGHAELAHVQLHRARPCRSGQAGHRREIPESTATRILDTPSPASG